MEYSTAKELLEKYWNCETSIQEEEMLRRYFHQENIPPDLKKYQDLFRYYSGEREKVLNGEFDDRILGMLETKKGRRQRLLGILYKVAAAVLLILSFVVINDRFIQVKDQAKQIVEDTFNDPEKALEETKKVLFFMSEKLNRGKEEITRLNKFRKAEEVVKNTNYEEI